MPKAKRRSWLMKKTVMILSACRQTAKMKRGRFWAFCHHICECSFGNVNEGYYISFLMRVMPSGVQLDTGDLPERRENLNLAFGSLLNVFILLYLSSRTSSRVPKSERISFKWLIITIKKRKKKLWVSI